MIKRNAGKEKSGIPDRADVHMAVAAPDGKYRRLCGGFRWKRRNVQ